eukprot:TRINITY_DN3550_c0_g1_i1.p1 TRINITY_DN3550_c0_g1~~TRINITY_DN3550_c0_g1_i1.p1  ORF type:complete len:1321 (-),score=272.30 TRINITY_DN3550_c0_g1_i1:120-4082(-)
MTTSSTRTAGTVPIVLVTFLYLCCSGAYASTTSSLSTNTVVADDASVFTLKAITASNFTISAPAAGYEWGAGLSTTVRWTQPAGSVPLNRIELLYGSHSTSTLVTSLWVGTTSSTPYAQNMALSKSVTIESGMTYRTNYFLRLYFGPSMPVNSAIFSVVNPALAASIKIGATPSGANNWAQGTYVRWTWTRSGFPSSSTNTVRIELLSGSTGTTVTRTLYSSTSNDGTQSIYMATSVADGSYRLRIKSNLYPTVSDTSEVFKVGVDPAALKIAVTTTFPTNVTMGTRYTLRWTRSGWSSTSASGYVRISMFKAGTTVSAHTIVTSTSNDGSYSFTAPTTLDEGRYFIRVQHRTYSQVLSSSNEFNLVKGETGYYRITSPSAGDTYQRGSRLSISYTKVGFPSTGYTRIELKSNDTSVRSYTVTSGTTSSLTRSYTLPTTMPVGGWQVALTWRPSFSSTSTPQYTTLSDLFTVELADYQKPPAITIRRPTETEASLITRTSSFTISWSTVGYKTTGQIRMEVVRVMDAQVISSAITTTDDGSYSMRLSSFFASDAVAPNFDCRIKLTHTTSPNPSAYTERFNLRGGWDGKDLPVASATPTPSPGSSGSGVSTTSSDGITCTGCATTVSSRSTLTIDWSKVGTLSSRSVVLVLRRTGDSKYERFLKSVTSISASSTTVTIPMAVSAKGYYIRVMDASTRTRKGDSSTFTLNGDAPFIAIVEPASADTIVEDRSFRIGVRTRGITPGSKLLVAYSVSASGSSSAFATGSAELIVSADGSAGTTTAIYDSPPGDSKLAINVQGTSALGTPTASSITVRFAAADDPLVRPVSSGELRLPMPSAPFGTCVAVDQADPNPPAACSTWRPTNFCQATSTSSSSTTTLRNWAFPAETDHTCTKWLAGLTDAQKAEICPNDPSALAPCATQAEWCGKYLPSCIRGYSCRVPLPCWHTCYPCKSRSTCSALVRAGQLAKPYARHCYSVSSTLAGQTQTTRLISMAYTGSASAFLEGEADWIDSIASKLSISTDALTVVAFESGTSTQRVLESTSSSMPPALGLLQAESSKVYVEVAYDESSGKTAQESTNAMVRLVASEGSQFAVANVVDETSSQGWDSGTVSGGSTGSPNTGTPSTTVGPTTGGATTPTPGTGPGVASSDDEGLPTMTIVYIGVGAGVLVMVIAISLIVRRQRAAAAHAASQQQAPHPHQMQPPGAPTYQYQNPQHGGVAGYGFTGQQPGNHHIMIGGAAAPLPDIAHAGGHKKGHGKKKKKGGRSRSKSPYRGGDIPMEPPSYADVIAGTTDDGSMATSTAASTSDLSSSSTSASSTSS